MNNTSNQNKYDMSNLSDVTAKSQDNTAGRVEKYRLDFDGEIVDYEDTYDANNRLVKQVVKDINGNISCIDEWEFDAEGHNTLFTRKNADGEVTSKMESIYENGNRVKSIDINFEEDSIAETTYCQRPNPDYGSDPSEPPTIDQEVEVMYKNLKGQPTLYEKKDEESGIYNVEVTEWAYDDKGKERKVETKNANGDVTKKVLKDGEGNVTKIEMFEYEYDDDGNQTKIVDKDGEGNVLATHEYTYTYNKYGDYRCVTTYDDGSVSSYRTEFGELILEDDAE